MVRRRGVWEVPPGASLRWTAHYVGTIGPASAAIRANGFQELPIVPRDAEDAGNLAWPHTDPFDRLLVAQAIRLGFVRLTADQAIRTFAGVAQLPAG
jgi:hypothetical protein